MTMINLLEVLEGIRTVKYPHLDQGLVEGIVKIQTDFLDSPAESFGKINQFMVEQLREERGFDVKA